MGRNDVGDQRPTRVHAIVLTRDRPQILKRCVDTALSALGAVDALTVLDDSCAAVSHANEAALADGSRRSNAMITHLGAEQVHDVIARATGGQGALWQSRTALRDIAPLRNLTLLLSAVVDAKTTVLVDDDICDFDLLATHRILDAKHRSSGGGLVAGAQIGGTTEQDTLTRLSDAMRLLHLNYHESRVPAESLFRMLPESDRERANPCGWLSGGYMAFRLPTTGLFAFPPGYNEDWLWCILHAAGREACLLRIDQTVMHEPPMLRKSTRDDILFELGGDLILDRLEERRYETPRKPEWVLEHLLDGPPDLLTPSVRAETVLKQARGLSGNGHISALADLERYGLSALREMRVSGELEMDSIKRLRAWSADAAAKHRSFAKTLGTATVWCALRKAFKEGGN